MRLTPALSGIIRRFVENTGRTAKSLADELNLSNATPARWVNGTSKNIRNLHWKKLKKIMFPFLSKEEKNTIKHLRRGIDNTNPQARVDELLARCNKAIVFAEDIGAYEITAALRGEI